MPFKFYLNMTCKYPKEADGGWQMPRSSGGNPGPRVQEAHSLVELSDQGREEREVTGQQPGQILEGLVGHCKALRFYHKYG